jgi:hypothetical protein
VFYSLQILYSTSLIDPCEGMFDSYLSFDFNGSRCLCFRPLHFLIIRL